MKASGGEKINYPRGLKPKDSADLPEWVSEISPRKSRMKADDLKHSVSNDATENMTLK